MSRPRIENPSLAAVHSLGPITGLDDRFFQIYPKILGKGVRQLTFASKSCLVDTGLANPKYHPAVVFICTNKAKAKFCDGYGYVKPASWIILYKNKFYRRLTFGDIGEQKRRGLQRIIKGRLVFFVQKLDFIEDGKVISDEVAEEVLNEVRQ